MYTDLYVHTLRRKMAFYVLFFGLLAPSLLWAFSKPALLPLRDLPVLTIDATGIDIAFGPITQDVTVSNPTGRVENRQVLRIELSSKAPQKITWGDQFQPKHGIRLPTHTTGNDVIDQWIFEYVEPLRLWSFIGTTQPVFVPAPAGPPK